MKGPEGFRPFYSAFSQAFPDLHIEVLRAIVQGEFVVVHNRGTIARIVDGKIVEGWNFYDFLSMYQQLGVTPPMGV